MSTFSFCWEPNGDLTELTSKLLNNMYFLHLQDPRKVRVWAEKVFRGRKYKNLVEVCSVSYKPDYRLIHKDEEAAYCKVDTIVPFEKNKILPRTLPFPPLLKVRNSIMKSGITLKFSVYL